MSISVNGSVGVSQNTTEVTKIPVGTTAQRPANPEAGMIRFNTDVGNFEFYSGNTWTYMGLTSTVFFDGFEIFEGWTTQGTGSLSQSNTEVFQGSFSALKDVGNDPNGAFKLLDAPVGRHYTLKAYVFSEEPRIGGDADRISIVDSNGDGYGLNIQSSSLTIDIRNSWEGTTTVTENFQRPSNEWYKVIFKALPDNSFNLAVYSLSNILLGTVTLPSDSTHVQVFDRVAILGGHKYYVDNLSVKKDV